MVIAFRERHYQDKHWVRSVPAFCNHCLPFVFCFRFMLQWPGVRILRRNELDAFLAQALSPKLYEPDQLQELKVILLWCLYEECPENSCRQEDCLGNNLSHPAMTGLLHFKYLQKRLMRELTNLSWYSVCRRRSCMDFYISGHSLYCEDEEMCLNKTWASNVLYKHVFIEDLALHWKCLHLLSCKSLWGIHVLYVWMVYQAINVLELCTLIWTHTGMWCACWSYKPSSQAVRFGPCSLSVWALSACDCLPCVLLDGLHLLAKLKSQNS